MHLETSGGLHRARNCMCLERGAQADDRLDALTNAWRQSAAACTRLLVAALMQSVLVQRPDAEAAAGVLTQAASAAADVDAPVERAFADVLLDVVWALDMELDARREVSVAREGGEEDVSLGTLENAPLQLGEARSRLAEVLALLIESGVVDRRTACVRLDAALLGALGAVDVNVFHRRGIQIRTATLFKQHKYNLLREENEGYTALLTTLVDRRGPPLRAEVPDGVDARNGPVDVVEQETSAARNVRAAQLMDDLSAQIGCFHLDASRVLDLVLDVFASNVVRHYPFYLALLAVSPWDARMLATVLGFKMQHFARQDSTPEEMYLVAVLLLREKLVRLDDLLPYLAPGDDGLAQLKARYQDKLAEKSASSGANALTMAAPLVDDDDAGAAGSHSGSGDAAAGDASAPERERGPVAQVVGLIRVLLACGQLAMAQRLLGPHPWLFGAFPDLTATYMRMLRHVVAPVVQSGAPGALVAPHTVLGAVLAPRGRAAHPPGLFLTPYAPEPRASVQKRSVFFLGDWAHALPQCTNAEQLRTVFLPLLAPLGVQVHQDISFFTLVCRLAAQYMADDRETWLGVVRNLLLPGVALTEANAAVLYELWAVLAPLPYEERFALYGEWKHRAYKRPELKFRQRETEQQARSILRRVSADNVRTTGRSLAKAAHGNATVFFTVMLNQIQSYDNLIDHAVDAAKYLTPLEYDVFTYSLIEALSNPEKERTKSDGTNTSLWLKSLATFAGQFYKKYAAMDCTPVLQYLANRLKANNVKDLVILVELVLKMSGIEPLAELSESQIGALTGGPLLHTEAAMTVAPGGRASSPTSMLLARSTFQKGAARLMHTLRQSRLALPLLVQVAQQRQVCVYLVPEGEGHIKALASTFDTCQQVLFQYVEFLTQALEPAEFAELMPGPDALAARFALEPCVAFHCARPKLQHAMRQVKWELPSGKKRTAERSEVAKGDAEPGEQPKEGGEQGGDAEEGGKQGGDAEDNSRQGEVAKAQEAVNEGEDEVMQDGTAQPAQDTDTDKPEDMEQDTEPEVRRAEQTEKPVGDAESATPIASPMWHPVLMPLIASTPKYVPESALSALGAPFFVTFWQMCLADIAVPMDRYQQETNRLRQWIRDVETSTEQSENLKKSARVRLQDRISQLNAELKEQTLAHQATRRRLAYEKSLWFAEHVDRALLAQQMIEQCLYPRALLSPTDAMFAARFLRLLHTNGTHNLSTLAVYDALFLQHVPQTLFSATENEARNYARFLHGLLSDIHPWLASEQVYQREAIGDGLPGFALGWHGVRGSRVRPHDTPLTWQAFRNTVLDWHTTLCDAFATCFRSGEYMRVRNAIVVLNRIAPFFPLYRDHGRTLQAAVEDLVQHESRGDLRVLAQGLVATLKKRSSEWVGLRYFKRIPPELDAEAPPKPEPEPEKPKAQPAAESKAPPSKKEPAKREKGKPEGRAENKPPTPRGGRGDPPRGREAPGGRDAAPEPSPRRTRQNEPAPQPAPQPARSSRAEPPEPSPRARAEPAPEPSPGGGRSRRARRDSGRVAPAEPPADERPRGAPARGPAPGRGGDRRDNGWDSPRELPPREPPPREPPAREPPARGGYDRRERDWGWERAREDRMRERGWGASYRGGDRDREPPRGALRDSPREPPRGGPREPPRAASREPPRGAESNAQWNRGERREPTTEDERQGPRSRKRSLADRLGGGESPASPPGDAPLGGDEPPDSKRARTGRPQLRIHQAARQADESGTREPPSPPRRGGPPRRGWGRDWSQDGGWQDARERRASQDRERERKKRRAGDGR